MKVGLEMEYVVTVKQKKERKVEIFAYPKLIKKKYWTTYIKYNWRRNCQKCAREFQILDSLFDSN